MKPLYDKLRGPETSLSGWDKAYEQAFSRLKTLFIEAPAVALPGLERPLGLCVHERQGVVARALTQMLGPSRERQFISLNSCHGGQRLDSQPENCGSLMPFDKRGREKLWVSLQQSEPHTWSLLYQKLRTSVAVPTQNTATPGHAAGALPAPPTRPVTAEAMSHFKPSHPTS